MERDWQMLTAPELGDPLADIKEWMMPPYSDADINRRGLSMEKWHAMRERGMAESGDSITQISHENGQE